MADHATRRTTTDRLKEAISSLSDKHSDLASKVEAMCDRLSQLATLPPSLPPSSAPLRPTVKLMFPVLTTTILWVGSSRSPSSSTIKGPLRKNTSPWLPFILTALPSAGSNGCSRMTSLRRGRASCKLSKHALPHRSIMIPAMRCSSSHSMAQ